MGASSSKVDPEGLYTQAKAPAGMPVSVAAAQGPYLIVIYAFCLLCGANCSLYAVYLHLFTGHKRDPLFLHAAVFLSVACNLVLAIYGAEHYYRRSLIDLYSYPGFDFNKIEAYVVLYHTFQALPVAIGQSYFVVRVAKLFDLRKLPTQVGVVVAGSAIVVQLILMNWFGAAFYTAGYKTHLLDPKLRNWVRSILNAWSGLFIAFEVATTSTTIVRLFVLRNQTSMDAARRVLFNLALYSLQGQALLTAYSLTSLFLFSNSATGWYLPAYLISGSLYTLVLLANLIYRKAVSEAMKQAQSDYSSSRGTQRRFSPMDVPTFTSSAGPVQLPSIREPTDANDQSVYKQNREAVSLSIADQHPDSQEAQLHPGSVNTAYTPSLSTQDPSWEGADTKRLVQSNPSEVKQPCTGHLTSPIPLVAVQTSTFPRSPPLAHDHYTRF